VRFRGGRLLWLTASLFFGTVSVARAERGDERPERAQLRLQLECLTLPISAPELNAALRLELNEDQSRHLRIHLACPEQGRLRVTISRFGVDETATIEEKSLSKGSLLRVLALSVSESASLLPVTAAFPLEEEVAPAEATVPSSNPDAPNDSEQEDDKPPRTANERTSDKSSELAPTTLDEKAQAAVPESSAPGKPPFFDFEEGKNAQKARNQTYFQIGGRGRQFSSGKRLLGVGITVASPLFDAGGSLGVDEKEGTSTRSYSANLLFNPLSPVHRSLAPVAGVRVTAGLLTQTGTGQSTRGHIGGAGVLGTKLYLGELFLVSLMGELGYSLGPSGEHLSDYGGLFGEVSLGVGFHP